MSPVPLCKRLIRASEHDWQRGHAAIHRKSAESRALKAFGGVLTHYYRRAA